MREMTRPSVGRVRGWFVVIWLGELGFEWWQKFPPDDAAWQVREICALRMALGGRSFIVGGCCRLVHSSQGGKGESEACMMLYPLQCYQDSSHMQWKTYEDDNTNRHY